MTFVIALSFTGPPWAWSWSERTWTRRGWLHVEQSSYYTEKCTFPIYWFESSLEWKVQLLWSSGNAASPFPPQRWLCLSLNLFRALHESVSSVEGPFHVVWEMLHLNFSRFHVWLWNFKTASPSAFMTLIDNIFFFLNMKIKKSLWWTHKLEHCIPVAQNCCAAWGFWPYRLTADCSNREMNIAGMTQGIIKTTSSASNHPIPQDDDGVFI